MCIEIRHMCDIGNLVTSLLVEFLPSYNQYRPIRERMKCSVIQEDLDLDPLHLYLVEEVCTHSKNGPRQKLDIYLGYFFQ